MPAKLRALLGRQIFEQDTAERGDAGAAVLLKEMSRVVVQVENIGGHRKPPAGAAVASPRDWAYFAFVSTAAAAACSTRIRH